MNPRRHHSRYRQQGIAAVEFALVLPLLILLLVLPLYMGRILWHYAAMQTAAQNGARFLASVPLAVIKDSNKVGYATGLTRAIVLAHLTELNPGQSPPSVEAQCNGLECLGGANPPTTVRVVVRATMQDIFFPEYQLMDIDITAEARVAYLGK